MEIGRRNEFSLPPFSLACSRKTITNFKHMHVSFDVLKLKNNVDHHWIDSSGWEMAQAIECTLLNKTKDIVQVSTFFTFKVM